KIVAVSNNSKLISAPAGDFRITPQVSRYSANGALDRGFGTGGFVALEPVRGVSALGTGVLVQPDGKIVAVGALLGPRAQKPTLPAMAVRLDGGPRTTVQFSQAGTTISEKGGTAKLTVKLSAPATEKITVQYLITGGTANASDYHLTPGTLTFNPGQSSQD